jgi:hypothetical protein
VIREAYQQAAHFFVDTVAQAQDTVLVATPVGGMRLLDYLPTRVFELTIHTLDLATALALVATVPETAVRVTGTLIMDMALSADTGVQLLLATTGRRPLPAGFSVV